MERNGQGFLTVQSQRIRCSMKKMGLFIYMASNMGIVVVVRLKVCTGGEGVLVSELWGSEGV